MTALVAAPLAKVSAADGVPAAISTEEGDRAAKGTAMVVAKVDSPANALHKAAVTVAGMEVTDGVSKVAADRLATIVVGVARDAAKVAVAVSALTGGATKGFVALQAAAGVDVRRMLANPGPKEARRASAAVNGVHSAVVQVAGPTVRDAATAAVVGAADAQTDLVDAAAGISRRTRWRVPSAEASRRHVASSARVNRTTTWPGIGATAPLKS